MAAPSTALAKNDGLKPFWWPLQLDSGGGKHVLLWPFNGEKWGGTETEDTYTSTRKCTHRHTVGTGGSRDFRGLGSICLIFFCLPSLQVMGQWVYPKRCSEVLMLDLFTQICQSTVLKPQMCTADSAWNNIHSYRPSSTLSKPELFVANRTRGAIQTSARLALFF